MDRGRQRRRHLHPCSIKEDPHGHTPHFERRHILRHQRRHRPDCWYKLPNRGGRTLVNGTAYEVKFSDGLTWIINESPKIMVFEQAIDFTSNGKKFDYFMITAGSRPSIVYSYGPGDIWYAYFNGSWTQEAFRTVTFAEMPTGALLAWLQANAVQQ